MAEKPQTKANFPIPPPFYKHFTTENVTQIRQIRKKKSTQQQVQQDKPGEDSLQDAPVSKDSEIDLESLSPNLRYLVPPPPPADGKWRTFGAQHDLHAPDPSLEDAGVEVLYPNDPAVKLNPQPYLLSLARSLLTTFLALTGTLSEDPTQYLERVADLKTIVTNMHDLINQYRPHQARETLILMMEERIERLRGEIKAIGEAGERMDGVFQGLQINGESHAKIEESQLESKTAQDGIEDQHKQRQRAAWDALQEADLDDEET